MNLFVVNIKTGALYYEASSLSDAERNCPVGYRVRTLTDLEAIELGYIEDHPNYHRNEVIKDGCFKGLRYVNEDVGYVDEDEEYY